MTTHYVTQLGVAKCREILKGAPSWAEWWQSNGKYRSCFFACDHEGSQFAVMLSDLRTELSAHDTDDFTHLANHISPNTVVLEQNLQEQFQEANEAGEGR